jgi:hypothetical protein
MHIYNNDKIFGSYLAGLWEGDGSVAIKDKNFPKPTFHITFHIHQTPLAKKLLNVIMRRCGNVKVGSIYVRNTNNSS